MRQRRVVELRACSGFIELCILRRAAAITAQKSSSIEPEKFTDAPSRLWAYTFDLLQVGAILEGPACTLIRRKALPIRHNRRGLAWPYTGQPGHAHCRRGIRIYCALQYHFGAVVGSSKPGCNETDAQQSRCNCGNNKRKELNRPLLRALLCRETAGPADVGLLGGFHQRFSHFPAAAKLPTCCR